MWDFSYFPQLIASLKKPIYKVGSNLHIAKMALQTEILKSVLAKVDGFCKQTGMSLSQFGEVAMNDRGVIFALKSGKRSPRLSSLDRICTYIDDNPPKPADVVESNLPTPSPTCQGEPAR